MEQTFKTKLMLLVTIINKGNGQKIADLFSSEGVPFSLLQKGVGTTSSELLNYLGFAEISKEILLSTIPAVKAMDLVEKLDRKEYLDIPNSGISFAIPLESVCGVRTMKLLSGSLDLKGGIGAMEVISKHSAILVVVNRGYSDDVMVAARQARNTGGTVLHARGVGSKQAEKFLGVSIQPEKEMVLIVVNSKYREKMMTAIAEYPSLKEEHVVIFSLPVTGVAGLTEKFEEIDEV